MTTEELMICLVEVAAIKWKIRRTDCDRTKRGKMSCIKNWSEEKLIELDGEPDQEQKIEAYRQQFRNERIQLGLPV